METVPAYKTVHENIVSFPGVPASDFVISDTIIDLFTYLLTSFHQHRNRQIRQQVQHDAATAPKVVAKKKSNETQTQFVTMWIQKHDDDDDDDDNDLEHKVKSLEQFSCVSTVSVQLPQQTTERGELVRLSVGDDVGQQTSKLFGGHEQRRWIVLWRCCRAPSLVSSTKVFRYQNWLHLNIIIIIIIIFIS